jgi:hypothetical protein
MKKVKYLGVCGEALDWIKEQTRKNLTSQDKGMKRPPTKKKRLKVQD